jgi:hypothetical protein
MKKNIYIGIILLFISLHVTGQDKLLVNIDHPVYFTMLGNNEVKITRVKTGNKATILFFNYKGAPKSWIRVSSCIYLVDEQGNRHQQVGTKNIKLNKNTPCGKNGERKYQISFTPLPIGTKRFDMVEDYYNNLRSEFYGIREAGTPFVDSHAVDTLNTAQLVAKTFPDSIFREDSMWLTGYFDAPEILKKGKVTLQIERRKEYLMKTNRKYREISIDVDSSGYFKACIPVMGPSRECLRFMAHYADSMVRFIPVMLYPRDSLDIRIYDLDKPLQHVEYKSMKIDFSKLLNHAPSFFQPGIRFMNHDSLDTSWAIDTINKHIETLDSLALYIANKYSLSKVETQQLRTEVSIKGTLDVIYSLDNTLRHRQQSLLKRHKGIVSNDILDTLQLIATHPCYNVLSRIHACDNTFLTAINNYIFFHTLIPSALFCRFYSDLTMNGRFPSLGDNGANTDFYLATDSMFVSMLSNFRHKSGESDPLFEQSFLLNNYQTYLEANPLTCSNKTEIYQKLAAKKSSQITLPVLQGLVKVAIENFIDR